MATEKNIKHEGVVTAVRADKVLVNFVIKTACADCHAKGACSASDMKDQQLNVSSNGEVFSIGDKVNILIEQSTGIKAVLFAYVIPFTLLLLTLIIVSELSGNELKAGIMSLLILVPYYAVLYLSRNRLDKNFTFRLEKQL